MAEAIGGSQRVENSKGRATKHLEAKLNRASEYIQTGDIEDPRSYSNVCLSLGRSVDKAIMMDEVPSSSHLLQLALIVKEVYRCKSDSLQPSLVVFMLSIKAACRVGWFSDEDKKDFLMMAQKVISGFSDTDKMNIGPRFVRSYVSNLVSRFYPNLNVESILTAFDVKAGYGTYVADFHISRGTLPRHGQDLWLLVAGMDNMDTSACIVSPPNVDFLVNGSGVPRRTKRDMGKVPQLPSNLSKMFTFGVNLLQVLGEFDGKYIVVVAFMNLISLPDPPQLQDYVNPMSCGVDSDLEDSEMSSRVSLNCPISQHRIKTPVKGHLCKHPQCFDYKYFMEINSRWPTWKCPVCDNPVCHLDIRMDQTLFKILNEVAEDVSDVLISADGSWSAADMATNETYSTTLDTMTTTTTTTQPTKPSHPPTQAEPHQVQTDGSTVGTNKEAESTALTASGRMRGSLKGNKLAAARLQILAPPRQPARANQPWSRPTPTLPIHLLMKQPPNTSAGNNLNGSK